MSLITLHEWGKRLPVPRSAETLRRWVRSHKISPLPIWDGYRYLVHEDAEKIVYPDKYISKTRPSNSLTQRIKHVSTEKKP